MASSRSSVSHCPPELEPGDVWGAAMSPAAARVSDAGDGEGAGAGDGSGPGAGVAGLALAGAATGAAGAAGADPAPGAPPAGAVLVAITRRGRWERASLERKPCQERALVV